MTPNDAERETLLRTIESRGVLGKRFDDLKRLGTAGGDGYFSLIVTARDNQTSQRVALKFFHPSHLRDQYRWHCFLREPLVLQMFTGKPDILQCLAPRDEFTVPFTHMGMSLNIPFTYYAVEDGGCGDFGRQVDRRAETRGLSINVSGSSENTCKARCAPGSQAQ